MVTYESKKQNMKGQYSAMDLLLVPETGIYRSTDPDEVDVLVLKSQGSKENTLIALFDDCLQGLGYVTKSLSKSKTYCFLGHAKIEVVDD